MAGPMDAIRPKKSFGQNFLIDANVLSRIVSSVDRDENRHILEIGPGKGALTSLLAGRAESLIAVELDRQLAGLLEEHFRSETGVRIVQADVLNLDLGALLLPIHPGKWKVAANLPYNISSQVMFQFLDSHELFSSLVLMVQKEVGDRLVAPPDCKDYGILSVLFRLHFEISREFIVRPGAFFPAPKVDSAVLRFVPLEQPRYDVGDEAFFRRLVKGAFSMRRKTLWNCMKSACLAANDEALARALEVSGIYAGRRGETLSLEEFSSLSRVLQGINH